MDPGLSNGGSGRYGKSTRVLRSHTTNNGVNAVAAAKLPNPVVNGYQDPVAKVLGTPELFAELLKYLPKKDLLNCRTINHAWNSQILPVLLKRNVHILLTSENYLQYWKRMLESTRCPAASKIGLSCGIIFTFTPSDFDTSELIDFEKIGPYVKKVQRLKPDFLKDLFLDISDEEDKPIPRTSGFELLKLCAPGLQSLRINLSQNNPDDPEDKKFLQSLKIDYPFPELETLFFENNDNSYTKLLPTILNSAPRLKSVTLSIFGSTNLPTISAGAAAIRCDYVTEMTMHLCADVEKMVHLENLISKLQLPALRKLTVHTSIMVKLPSKSNLVFTNFLAHNCPLLNTLDFNFYGSRRESRIVFLPDLPVLQNLTRLSCSVENDGVRKLYVFVGQMAELQKKFPKLTTFNTTPGTYFVDSSVANPHGINFDNNRSVINGLELSGVSTLRLHDWFPENQMFASDYRFNSDGDLGSFNQLHLLFPKLQKLIISPLLQKSELEMGPGVFATRIWTKIIGKSLMEFDGLKELEIENCFDDYFSEIWLKLQEFEEDVERQQFPDITKLIIPPITWFRPGEGIWFKNPILDLFNLLLLFPNLRYLEIGTLFLGIGDHQIQLKLRKLREYAPGLTVICRT